MVSGKTLGAGRVVMTRVIDNIVPAKVLFQSRTFDTRLSSVYFEQMNVALSNVAISLNIGNSVVEETQLPFKVLLQIIPCSGTQLSRATGCKDIIAEVDLIEMQQRHKKLAKANRIDTIGLKRRQIVFRVIAIDIDPKVRYTVDPGLEINFDFTYDITQQYKYIANPKYKDEIDAEVERKTAGLRAQIESLRERINNTFRSGSTTTAATATTTAATTTATTF